MWNAHYGLIDTCTEHKLIMFKGGRFLQMLAINVRSSKDDSSPAGTSKSVLFNK